MDLTDTFRSEDISKTDFFDFVVGPDVNDSQQFTKQMRTVNAYLGNEQDPKETNNNGLSMEVLPTSGAQADSGNVAYDPTFWSCDKDTVRLESAILEDLNKYCWSEQDDAGTDGHIYTLTVLNGVDQTAPWYRPPLASLGIVKEEDGSMSSPASLEQLQQQALDIDSILNIIPPAHALNGYGVAPGNPIGSVYLAGASDQGLQSPNTDGLIKSETYTYEDSGFADNKDELTTSMIIDTPMLEAHEGYNNNNNNDWKLNNNNSNVGASSGSETADSLLRSALQGKTFVRYNGNASKIKQETHSELKRALSTPPSSDKVEEEPTLVGGIDTSAILFVDGTRLGDSDSAPSTHSVDDILLSQLEAASYPEDYEKLKRIANEVAESVQQYCQLDPIYTLGTTEHQVLPAGLPTVSVAVTSTKPATPKKYKRSNSGGGGSGSKTTNVQGATSTSNGVRKERSLHYCSICSKGFKDKYSVNVHIRTHTGEKPFACSLCGKSFRQKAHLAKHYQTHIAQKNAAAASAPKAGAKATR